MVHGRLSWIWGIIIRHKVDAIIEYDVIVVGGGSAGCVVAGRLSEDPSLSVLLMEAGGSDRHPFSRVPAASGAAVFSPRFNWMYEVEPDPTRAGKVDSWWSGLCLGGGSAINGMMFIRGHRDDYDRWSDLGCTGWDYASVLPYFKRLECNRRGEDEWRGRQGPHSVEELNVDSALTHAWVKAAQEAGIPRSHDLNGAEHEGVDYVQVAQRRGWRESAVQAYLNPVRKRSNLHIQLNSQVTRILFDGARANGIEFVRDGVGQYGKALARAAVILSAGSIASPKLLQLSGIGDAQALKRVGIDGIAHSPGAGKNLQEHTGIRYSFDVNGETLGSRTGPLHNVVQLIRFLVNGKGLLTTPIAHAHAFIRTREKFRTPNIQVTMAPFHVDIAENSAVLSKERIAGGAVGLMRTGSRGEIALRSSDPLEPPRIHYPMLDSGDDIEQLVDACRLARRITEQPAFAGHLVRWRQPDDEVFSGDQLRDFVKDAAFPMYHPVGTCRMGNDAQAVVSPDLKVRGVDGLWVIDASVMPTLVTGNTNATVLMIGEKGADLVRAALAG